MENPASESLDPASIQTQGRQVNVFKYLRTQVLFQRNTAELKNPPGKIPHCILLGYMQNPNTGPNSKLRCSQMEPVPQMDDYLYPTRGYCVEYLSCSRDNDVLN